jgi:hypothetical protein
MHLVRGYVAVAMLGGPWSDHLDGAELGDL